jgi:hypothetical protein
VRTHRQPNELYIIASLPPTHAHRSGGVNEQGGQQKAGGQRWAAWMRSQQIHVNNIFKNNQLVNYYNNYVLQLINTPVDMYFVRENEMVCFHQMRLSMNMKTSSAGIAMVILIEIYFFTFSNCLLFSFI